MKQVFATMTEIFEPEHLEDAYNEVTVFDPETKYPLRKFDYPLLPTMTMYEDLLKREGYAIIQWYLPIP